MKRLRHRALLLAPVLLLALAACGIQPTGPTGAGTPPTGVAPGVTLYFIDDSGRLQPQLRRTGHLGSISEALSLLLSGPGDSAVHSDIPENATTRVYVTTTPDAIELRVPFTDAELGELGADQIVCTALGVHVQSGGSTETAVRIDFTQPAPAEGEARTCPV